MAVRRMNGHGQRAVKCPSCGSPRWSHVRGGLDLRTATIHGRRVWKARVRCSCGWSWWTVNAGMVRLVAQARGRLGLAIPPLVHERAGG